MKKASSQTESLRQEAAEALAKREAAQRKSRLEQEQREAKERKERQARLLYEIEAKKRADEDAARREQKEKQRESEKVYEVPLLLQGKSKGTKSSNPNRAVRNLQEPSDKSRVSLKYLTLLESNLM